MSMTKKTKPPELTEQTLFTKKSSLDLFLSDSFDELQMGLASLTDAGRQASSLSLPVASGTRVAFKYNTGSVLTYESIPDKGVCGTVILVKTSSGATTCVNDHVFVKWDDGHFRSIHINHLKKSNILSKKAFNITFETVDFNKIAFNFEAATADELIHKSTKDLWRLKKSKDKFVIERLFDEKGEPLKV